MMRQGCYIHIPGGNMEDRIVGGIISSVLGDALGVPVEFEDREYLRKNPVHDFLEFGTYNQPKGTWSDDSSLLLCTLESLNKKQRICY